MNTVIVMGPGIDPTDADRTRAEDCIIEHADRAARWEKGNYALFRADVRHLDSISGRARVFVFDSDLRNPGQP